MSQVNRWQADLARKTANDELTAQHCCRPSVLQNTFLIAGTVANRPRKLWGSTKVELTDATDSFASSPTTTFWLWSHECLSKVQRFMWIFRDCCLRWLLSPSGLGSKDDYKLVTQTATSDLGHTTALRSNLQDLVGLLDAYCDGIRMLQRLTHCSILYTC